MGFLSKLAPAAIGAGVGYFAGPQAGMAAYGGANSLFNKPKNPSNAAMPYLNQLSGIGHQTYDPYIQQGQRQGNALESQYSQMFQDPTAFLNSLQSGYEPSQGYQYRKETLGRELGNNAAAGGFSGTTEHNRAHGDLINGLLSQDMQGWLDNLLNIQGRGLQGAEGQSQRGFQASQGLGDYLGTGLGAQASYASGGQAYGNANRNLGNQNFMSSISKLFQDPTFLKKSGLGDYYGI